MSIPVLSLAGRTVVNRAGLSILTNAGLPGLVAEDADDYIRRAIELATDLPVLRDLRATLREQLSHSTLMDVTRFARNIEAAYRNMWHAWCARI